MIDHLIHLAAHHVFHHLCKSDSKSKGRDIANDNSTNNALVASKVIAITADKLGVEPYEVTTDASFVNDLGADSLDLAELVMKFEKEFSITVKDDEAERVQTVGEAISLIQSHMR